MPFKSQKQRAFAYANPEKFGGDEGIKEWEGDTPSDLPKYANKSGTTSPDVKKKFQYTGRRSGYKKSQRLA